MNSLNRFTFCPVCGFDLGFQPWTEESGASHEICPSCGIEFGYDDVFEACGIEGTREELQLQWREKWIAKGMKWSSQEIKVPARWDPHSQLRRLGLGT